MISFGINLGINKYLGLIFFLLSLLVRAVAKKASKLGDRMIRPPGEKNRHDVGRETLNIPEHRRSSRLPESSSSGGSRKSSRRARERKPVQSDGRPSDEPSEKRRPGRPEGCGFSPCYATEGYRHGKIPHGMYENENVGNRKIAAEIAKLIVEDMTTHFNLGLVIPPNAKFTYDGWLTSCRM